MIKFKDSSTFKDLENYEIVSIKTGMSESSPVFFMHIKVRGFNNDSSITLFYYDGNIRDDEYDNLINADKYNNDYTVTNYDYGYCIENLGSKNI